MQKLRPVCLDVEDMEELFHITMLPTVNLQIAIHTGEEEHCMRLMQYAVNSRIVIQAKADQCIMVMLSTANLKIPLPKTVTVEQSWTVLQKDVLSIAVL